MADRIEVHDLADRPDAALEHSWEATRSQDVKASVLVCAEKPILATMT